MAIVEASEDEVNTLKVTDAPGSALNDVEEELINDIAFRADVSPLLLSKVMSESPLVQEMFKIVKDGNHGLFNREDLVSHLVDVTGMSKLEIEQTLDAASKQNELLKIDERNSTKH